MSGPRRYLPADGDTTAADPRRPTVLVIDNYDSFTFNLVQYLLELGAVVDVIRNDAMDVEGVVAHGATHVLLSPGPGRPEHSGICPAVCRRLTQSGEIPMLGVCLGHQALCAELGADVVVADRIMHGKISAMHHDGSGIFEGLDSPLRATRYHSLIVDPDTLPATLLPVARTDRGELMAVRHKVAPAFGVQFHPESILSEQGRPLLRNFLAQRPSKP